MKLKNFWLVLTGIACASVLSSTANAAAADDDHGYFTYEKSKDGTGMAGIAYWSVQACQRDTGQDCIMPDFSCNGHKFATGKISYGFMEEFARGPNGDWRIAVTKDAADLMDKYQEAKESNFEIKLCQSD